MKPPGRAFVDRGKLWVHWEGRIYRIELEPKARPSGTGDEADELVAPFSCKILKLHVIPGEAVKKGAPVLSVEAMKMEFTYNSPRDGKIAKLNVAEGEVVSEGTHFVNWAKV